MVKKGNSTQDRSLPLLTIPRQEAEQKLKAHLDKGKELHNRPIEAPADLEQADSDRQAWTERGTELLRRIFTTDAEAVKFRGAGPTIHMGVGRDDRPFGLADKALEFRSRLKYKITDLESLLGRLDVIDEAPGAITSVPTVKPAVRPQGKKVFIVHGHDGATKEKAARLLSKLGLEPTILHEQPNRGGTIIEKIERESADVGFAVVILSADDVGHSKDEPEQAKPRARQNVIFELGFFVGSLGRERVCALYGDGVEVPSDYHGVIYTPLDQAEVWQFKLAKELRAAGYEVDLNNLG